MHAPYQQTGSLTARAKKWVAGLFDKGFDPATIKLPQVNRETGESNIKGLYIIGEVGGTPLIKLGLNAGHDVIERLFGNEKPRAKLNVETGTLVAERRESEDGYLDVLIVGAGASGLGAAWRAHELGVNYLVVEQGAKPAMLIRRFTKGKPLFAEPLDIPNKTGLWFEECKKEELLTRWDKQIAEKGLRIQTLTTVTDIKKLSDGFELFTNKGTFRARYVVLAIGKAGNPRKAGVPGEEENLEKISHFLADADEYQGKNILIYGGGDVAAEAALMLCDRNAVTLAAIEEEFIFPKKRNVDGLRAKQREGKLTIRLGHKLKEIRRDAVVLENIATKQTSEIPNDHVFEMIGAELPLKFFQKVGIKLEGAWDWQRYAFAAAVFALVYTIYGVKSHLWPFASDALLGVAGDWLRAQLPRYWYSGLYTLIVTIFGLRAAIRWGKHDRYQRWRYASLIGFQWIFAFIIPEFVAYAHDQQNYWRAYGIEYAWPLFFNTFFDQPPWWYVAWGALFAFVIIPWFAIRHGKRYCTWICGCGGLAETLGDRWRHLAPKGRKSVRWEFMNLVVLALAVLTTVMVLVKMPGHLSARQFYSVFVDLWLVGIIPISAYPFFGGKVWCRYWCPLAKYMQLISKYFGRLRITSNDKCITCGECSRYCQVGIDVMSFAKNQQEFSNKNTSCIQCGVCITVCPMHVLKFDATLEPKPARVSR
jgi:NosR/NirI family nitrous oxide reductase transcriptional regulator